MILGWAFFRINDAVIGCRNEELQPPETFPNTSSKESHFTLFAATDYLIEVNSSKQICALNPGIRNVKEVLLLVIKLTSAISLIESS
ncbi:hypothetical protein TNIN_298371 [Trichonephila inaurata madagascariensis]|uniref:Uncharacterized protein n=1 Tax=Trichonephila inaurata madagascariensis TaxID=2747483 RepID=A0A8X6X9R3_9ARAC|nr:hypothetical protein TNIN_274071 [Trichonephila inaurata madagascariensis]GFY70852.1 hypothetical protein TNIN_298371 [Trichonephila inaurata madagascariensis]